MKIFSKKSIIIASVFIGLLALAFVLSTVSLQDVVDAFKNATWQMVTLFIFVQILLFYIAAFRWKVVLKSQGYDVGLFKVNNYRLVGYAVSFLTPTAKIGGEPVRAGLLSEREGIPFDKSLSSVVIDKTLELSTSVLFFVVGGFLMIIMFVVDSVLKGWIIGSSIVLLFVIVLFNYRMIKGKSFFHMLFNISGLAKFKKLKKFGVKLKKFERLIIKFYHRDRKHFIYTLLISLVLWLLMFAEFWAAGMILGESLNLLQLFLVFSFIGVAYLIPIPMGLGALEAGQASVFTIVGIGAAVGIGLAFIVRLKDMIVSAIGMILLTVYGLKVKDVVGKADRLDKEVDALSKLEEAKN